MLVATFSVANPLATANDYILPTIVWGNAGSNSAVSILPISNTPNGVVFGVYGALPAPGFLTSGTFATTVTIVSKFGSTAIAAGQAVIAHRSQRSRSAALCAIAGTPTGIQPVATFTDTTSPLATSS